MVSGVALLVVVAALSVYALARPTPILLTLVPGTTTLVLAKDFPRYPWTNTSLIWYANATTDALQGGGPISTLTLRFWVAAFIMNDGATVELALRGTVEGHLASNLDARDVTVTLNQTGAYASGVGFEEPGPSNVSYSAPGPVYVAFPGPQNVTYDATPIYQINGPGSGSLTRSLENQTNAGPYGAFVLPVTFDERDALTDKGFVGVTASVAGNFLPSISVSIVLQIVNTPVA